MATNTPDYLYRTEWIRMAVFLVTFVGLIFATIYLYPQDIKSLLETKSPFAGVLFLFYLVASIVFTRLLHRAVGYLK